MYKCKSIFLKLWNFKSWLNFARKKLARANSIWHFWFLIAEAYLEPSQTSTIKLFRISGKSSIVDVRLCLRIGYCNLHFSSRLFSLLSRFFFFFFLRKIIQGKRHEVKQERLSAVILTYRFSKSFSILFHCLICLVLYCQLWSLVIMHKGYLSTALFSTTVYQT